MSFYDKELARVKSFYYRKVREFFDGRGYLEVEVPCMTPTVDPEPAMRHFETVFEDMYGVKTPMYLVTSPELQMKKLLGAGFGDIYTLARVFRNGEAGGGRHNTEFTMLEWYKMGVGFEEMMGETEELVKWVAGEIDIYMSTVSPGTVPGLSCSNLKDSSVPGQSRDENWDRKSLNDLFIEYCGINLNENREVAALKSAADSKGYDTNACETWDDVMYKIFLNHIEPKLGFERPVFVYNYPASQAALAKKCESDPFWAERFELYINGNELCNGFSELTDAVEQRKRFEEQNEIRSGQGRTTFPVDEEFLSSLESIHLKCGGNALGLDRLLKVMLKKSAIEDVMLFPIEKLINK